MTARTLSYIAGTIFILMALLQLTRALAGWDVVIASTSVPVWVSWVIGVIATTLGWLGLTARP
ncbi:MAG: hypothetical protein ACK4TP_18855 [Hyphomicrobium sp.]